MNTHTLRFALLLAVLAGTTNAALAQQAPTSTPPLRPLTVAEQARAHAISSSPVKGYYRMPALRGDTIVFVSEGDLWRVPVSGGIATRITTHAGVESLPALSPDGTTLAFAATYEGPNELYTMPLVGGPPTRRTFDGSSRINHVSWARDGVVSWSSDAGTTLPRSRTHTLDLSTGARTLLPLDACDEACFLPDGRVVFTRLPFQGSHTDRYAGGSVQNLWLLDPAGTGEATRFLPDDARTSRRPLWHDGRIYFTSDRAGFLNIWSMTPGGQDLRQHTSHTPSHTPSQQPGGTPWGDIGSSSLDAGRIVYQLGADLWLLDLATGISAPVPITLQSDVDQTRENWVDKPLSLASSITPLHDGSGVVITARGRVFVFPAGQGRAIDVDPRSGIRYREARELPVADGSKRLLAISDESGELELVTMPLRGLGASGGDTTPTRITTSGETVRWWALPSPDGKWIVHTDKQHRLFIHDVAARTDTLIAQSQVDTIGQMSWSGDSRWLAFVQQADNMLSRVHLYDTATRQSFPVTTDRYDSFSPRFDPKGDWLYFLSDRTFKSVSSSPWGSRAPEALLDKQTRIYGLALRPGLRWPFAPEDEVLRASREAEEAAKKAEKDANKDKNKDAPKDEAQPADAKNDEAKPAEGITIDPAGIMQRIELVGPVPAGNYRNLMANDKGLFIEEVDAEQGQTFALKALKVASKDVEVKTVAGGIRQAELSGDNKKLLLRKGDSLHLVDADVGEAKLDDKNRVDLSGWTLSITPREEWRQLAIDSWRLLRDYFYARNMHGVNWRDVLERSMPLVERVHDRHELNDVLAQMSSELAALHHFVRGGDTRAGEDSIAVASLGAVLERDEPAGGWRIARVFEGDPDEPWLRSPLREQHASVSDGAIILSINGVPTLSVGHPHALLRGKAGKQVLLRIRDGTGERDVIVHPLSQGQDADLRYRTWQVERRTRVEQASGGRIGYVHLRAMGGANFAEFARDFYPAFHREGLIIDVRDNRGGNIDSWILSRLSRKAWMHWNQHAGRSNNWNMQFAFRGHMVCLINERTASDGEAFAEGFKRLGLGPVIGTRTWGGEIWLTSSNTLADGGLSSAGEFGVFDEKGQWLIEGHGVEPDITVDNTPRATFEGSDAQLDAAVQHLLKKMQEQPVTIPPVPPFPDKSKP